MLNLLSLFSKRSGCALLLLLCFSFTTDPDEHLKGKWISCSMTYRDKEIELKKKHDKILLIFEVDKSYAKHYYTYNKDSNPSTLSYNSMSGEIKDITGKALKKRKTKEEGTYQVRESEILFVTSNESYSAQYQINGEFLLLTQFGDDSLRTRPFTIKFKRMR